MAAIPFTTRLAIVGATPAEVVSIQAAYDIVGSNVQDGVDSLVAAIDNNGLVVLLTNFRAGTGFHAGLPGVSGLARTVGRKR